MEQYRDLIFIVIAAAAGLVFAYWMIAVTPT
jgi:hypothetical protein